MSVEVGRSQTQLPVKVIDEEGMLAKYPTACGQQVQSLTLMNSDLAAPSFITIEDGKVKVEPREYDEGTYEIDLTFSLSKSPVSIKQSFKVVVYSVTEVNQPPYFRYVESTSLAELTVPAGIETVYKLPEITDFEDDPVSVSFVASHPELNSSSVIQYDPFLSRLILDIPSSFQNSFVQLYLTLSDGKA